MSIYSVYWIHRKSEDDIFHQGYVGKTNDIEKRWNRHRLNIEVKNTKRNKQPLYVSFRENGLEDFVFEVIQSRLDEQSAFNLEYSLRPCFGIGYNIGAGGTYSSIKQCTTLSPLRNTLDGKKRIDKYCAKVERYYSKQE